MFLPGTITKTGIIDAGCLFGASTLALAGGLRERAEVVGRTTRPIQSFDLFETNPLYDAFFHGYHEFGPTSNALYSFLYFNKHNLDLISLHQGDFLR